MKNYIVFFILIQFHCFGQKHKKTVEIEINSGSFFSRPNSIKTTTISKDTIVFKDTITKKSKKPLTFIFSPVNQVNISSKYSLNRFHPVTKEWKAHKGTDFAAPYGTPIKATAGGVIVKADFDNANGNNVKIKHDSIYATQYLHMSKILVKIGQRIEQGDVIGLVGSTGLSTAPHICYRFWKNGVQIDPLKLNFKSDKKRSFKDTIVSKNRKEFEDTAERFFSN